MNRTAQNQCTPSLPIPDQKSPVPHLKKLEWGKTVQGTSAYQPPTITTFTAEELLDIIGPVQAGGSDLEDMGPMGLMDPSGTHELNKILKVI